MDDRDLLQGMQEEEELDIVVFEDDQGHQIQMEVIDYLFYEGKEYALLAELVAGPDSDSDREAYVMEVVPVDGDPEMEEFVPVDEALAEQLIEVFENIDLEDEVFEDE